MSAKATAAEPRGHLILSRCVGESLTLTLPDGERLVVEVVRGGAHVRLRIDAPRSVVIDRTEKLT